MFTAAVLVALLIAGPLPIPKMPPAVVGTVAAPFVLKPATLAVVNTNGGLPPQAFERLSLLLPGKSVTVEVLNDLTGSVKINSVVSALNYVRLKTSPSTWFMWPGTPTVEVIDRSQRRTLSNYGLESYVSLGAGQSGCLGIFVGRDMQRLGLSGASVANVNGKYVIKRWLLTEPDDHHTYLIRVEETVTPSGSYSVKIIGRGPSDNGIKWYIPKFE